MATTGAENGQTDAWTIGLDETKRYFVLRRPEDQDKTKNPALATLGKLQADQTFKEICDQYRCGVRTVDHIYCYGCDAISHGICQEHPLVFVVDQPVKMEAIASSTLPSFMCLKESKIPNAGLGVFTTIFLPAGTAFGPYGGVMLYGDDSEIVPEYSWEIEVLNDETDITVDAKDPQRSNFLRWINCARFKEEQNMICVQFHKRMYYVVFKPIYPEEELTVWYGESYAGGLLGIKDLRRSTDCYAPPKSKRDPKAFMTSWPKSEAQ